VFDFTGSPIHPLGALSYHITSMQACMMTILHNMEELSTMTLALVIGKLVVFDMSLKICQEETKAQTSHVKDIRR
jgi:hypothetical protein